MPFALTPKRLYPILPLEKRDAIILFYKLNRPQTRLPDGGQVFALAQTWLRGLAG